MLSSKAHAICELIRVVTISAVTCRYTQDFVVENTSEIAMRYVWRIERGSQASSVAKHAPPREFNIIPSTGAILPGDRQTVRIELISQTVGVYKGTQLVLDLPNVEPRASAVPIAATCVVPRLSIPTATLDFDLCFLQHPAKRTLTLRNEEELPAKFQVAPQDAAGAALAEFTAAPACGAIPASGAHSQPFSTCPVMLTYL